MDQELSREFYFVRTIHSKDDHDPQSDRLEFTLDYFEGGFLVYQCTRTPINFRSINYKLREFKASNGITLASKNSPVFVSPDLIYFQGAYEDFALKPNLYWIGNEYRFHHICEGIRIAADELIEYLRGIKSWESRLRPQVLSGLKS